MKVKMRVGITGTHNGVPYPPPGGVWEVPDALGAKLCAGGLAEPVVEKDADVELRDEPVKRGPGRPRKITDKE